MKYRYYTIAVLVFLMVATTSFAQEISVRPTAKRLETKEVKPRPSPTAITRLNKGDGYAKIVYSQPHLRDRTMLGGKVPYGKVWRFGANEATELTINKAATVGGQTLQAGTYALFAIPEKDKWTLIISNVLGSWGSFGYKEESDVARIELDVKVVPESLGSFEAFTIWFDEDGTQFHAAWGTDWVSIPIDL